MFNFFLILFRALEGMIILSSEILAWYTYIIQNVCMLMTCSKHLHHSRKNKANVCKMKPLNVHQRINASRIQPKFISGKFPQDITIRRN